MECDVWFSTLGDQLFVAVTKPGQEPVGKVRRASSVSFVYKRIRERGDSVAQVGIVSPEMLGLE